MEMPAEARVPLREALERVMGFAFNAAREGRWRTQPVAGRSLICCILVHRAVSAEGGCGTHRRGCRTRPRHRVQKAVGATVSHASRSTVVSVSQASPAKRHTLRIAAAMKRR